MGFQYYHHFLSPFYPEKIKLEITVRSDISLLYLDETF